MGRRRHDPRYQEAPLSDPVSPFRIVRHEEHHTVVFRDGILKAKEYVKIATANVKDIYVRKRRWYRSIVGEFEKLVERDVKISILHGGRPSGPFRESLAARPTLARSERFEMMFCRRSHMKIVAVDGRFLYTGSANLTGAGLGARGASRRNLELGLITTDRKAIRAVEAVFDEAWEASFCETCAFRKECE